MTKQQARQRKRRAKRSDRAANYSRLFKVPPLPQQDADTTWFEQPSVYRYVPSFMTDGLGNSSEAPSVHAQSQADS